MSYKARQYLNDIYVNYRLGKRILKLPHYIVFCDSEYLNKRNNNDPFLIAYEFSFLVYDTVKNKLIMHNY